MAFESSRLTDTFLSQFHVRVQTLLVFLVQCDHASKFLTSLFSLAANFFPSTSTSLRQNDNFSAS